MPNAIDTLRRLLYEDEWLGTDAGDAAAALADVESLLQAVEAALDSEPWDDLPYSREALIAAVRKVKGEP